MPRLPEIDIIGNEHALIVTDPHTVAVYSFDRVVFQTDPADETRGHLVFTVTRASHHDREVFTA